MAVLLDSFVHHVRRNEMYASWHPKIALIRLPPSQWDPLSAPPP
jgi:hypothetical protein